MNETLTTTTDSSPPQLVWGAGFINFSLATHTESLALVLAARPPPACVFLSFGSGRALAAQVRATRPATVILSQVQSTDGAIEAADYSDALVLQGSEAGGHGASSFTLAELLADVQREQQAGRIPAFMPLLLAGGLGSPESIADAMSRPGVSGLVLGTRFLACRETAGPPAAKEIAIASTGADTHRGTVFDRLIEPTLWAAPFDGRAVLHGQAQEWLGREDELAREPTSATEVARFRASRPVYRATAASAPGLTVWAGTGLDAVTKVDESAGDVVRDVSQAISEGWSKRSNSN